MELPRFVQCNEILICGRLTFECHFDKGKSLKIVFPEPEAFLELFVLCVGGETCTLFPLPPPSTVCDSGPPKHPPSPCTSPPFILDLPLTCAMCELCSEASMVSAVRWQPCYIPSSYLYRDHTLEIFWAELMEIFRQRLQRSLRKRDLFHLSIATWDLLLMWVTTELCYKFPFLVSHCSFYIPRKG